MGRVKIKFPEQKPLITVVLPVRISDVNYGGHMGNDSVLSIIHEARMQLLHSWGYTELDAGGNSLIMADVMIAYKGQAYYADMLTVIVYVEEITEYSFDLLYLISTIRNEVKTDIAHAKTAMVCFDYKVNKVTEITKTLKGRLTENRI